MFMIGIRVGACLVNRTVDMLGRPIDRIKPKRFVTGAYHVMPGSLGRLESISMSSSLISAKCILTPPASRLRSDNEDAAECTRSAAMFG